MLGAPRSPTAPRRRMKGKGLKESNSARNVRDEIIPAPGSALRAKMDGPKLSVELVQAHGRGFKSVREDDLQSVASLYSEVSHSSKVSLVSVMPVQHAAQRSKQRNVHEMEIQLAKMYGRLLISRQERNVPGGVTTIMQQWCDLLQSTFPAISPRTPQKVEDRRVEVTLDGSDRLGPKVKKWLKMAGFFRDFANRLNFIHESATGEELVVVEGRMDSEHRAEVSVGIITVFRQHSRKLHRWNDEHAEIWDALARDDPNKLLGALQHADSSDAASFMLQLERALWNGGKGHGPLKSRRFGLIPLAAGNWHTPLDGALRCLEMLLRDFSNDGSAWTEKQLCLALSMARKRRRGRAMMMLKWVIDGNRRPFERVQPRPSEQDWEEIFGLLTSDSEIARISSLDGRLPLCTNGFGESGQFDGKVSDGRPQGYGTFTCLTGERISGTFNADGFPFGNILKTHSDGSTPFYIGGVNDRGQHHGRGVKYKLDGTPLFDGWFENNQFHREARPNDRSAQGPEWLPEYAERVSLDIDEDQMVFRPPWVKDEHGGEGEGSLVACRLGGEGRKENVFEGLEAALAGVVTAGAGLWFTPEEEGTGAQSEARLRLEQQEVRQKKEGRRVGPGVGPVVVGEKEFSRQGIVLPICLEQERMGRERRAKERRSESSDLPERVEAPVGREAKGECRKVCDADVITGTGDSEAQSDRQDCAAKRSDGNLQPRRLDIASAGMDTCADEGGNGGSTETPSAREAEAEGEEDWEARLDREEREEKEQSQRSNEEKLQSLLSGTRDDGSGTIRKVDALSTESVVTDGVGTDQEERSEAKLEGEQAGEVCVTQAGAADTDAGNAMGRGHTLGRAQASSIPEEEEEGEEDWEARLEREETEEKERVLRLQLEHDCESEGVVHSCVAVILGKDEGTEAKKLTGEGGEFDVELFRVEHADVQNSESLSTREDDMGEDCDDWEARLAKEEREERESKAVCVSPRTGESQAVRPAAFLEREALLDGLRMTFAELRDRFLECRRVLGAEDDALGSAVQSITEEWLAVSRRAE